MPSCEGCATASPLIFLAHYAKSAELAPHSFFRSVKNVLRIICRNYRSIPLGDVGIVAAVSPHNRVSLPPLSPLASCFPLHSCKHHHVDRNSHRCPHRLAFDDQACVASPARLSLRRLRIAALSHLPLTSCAAPTGFYAQDTSTAKPTMPGGVKPTAWHHRREAGKEIGPVWAWPATVSLALVNST